MANVIEMKEERKDFKEEFETTDMALFVRTSDESMHGWERQRIVDALIRETYIDVDTAKEIARERTHPVLVNAWLDRSDFREGSISIDLAKASAAACQSLFCKCTSPVS